MKQKHSTQITVGEQTHPSTRCMQVKWSQCDDGIRHETCGYKETIIVSVFACPCSASLQVTAPCLTFRPCSLAGTVDQTPRFIYFSDRRLCGGAVGVAPAALGSSRVRRCSHNVGVRHSSTFHRFRVTTDETLVFTLQPFISVIRYGCKFCFPDVIDLVEIE